MTVDRVLVRIDTDRSAQLVNRQQFYVSISRARMDVQVFTNNVERLPTVVSRELVKTTAREAVREPLKPPRWQQEQGRRNGPGHQTSQAAHAGRHEAWRSERSGIEMPAAGASSSSPHQEREERQPALSRHGTPGGGWQR